MKVTVIGCSGSYPGPDSPASCYLLEEEGPAPGGGTRIWRLLVDLGSGALGVLHRYADPLAIDAVVLSHLHADHCLDLCGYYVLRKYHPLGHQPKIPVWGPEDTANRMARAYDLDPDPGMTEEFCFRSYPQGEFPVGPFTVEAVGVAHPVPAYALRIRGRGGLLAYSGDCGPCAGLERAAEGADLLLAESAFRDGEENPTDLHLTGGDVGDVAVRAGVGRVVLTHIPPWHDKQRAYDEARARWTGPLDLARVGAVYEL